MTLPLLSPFSHLTTPAGSLGTSFASTVARGSDAAAHPARETIGHQHGFEYDPQPIRGEWESAAQRSSRPGEIRWVVEGPRAGAVSHRLSLCFGAPPGDSRSTS